MYLVMQHLQDSIYMMLLELSWMQVVWIQIWMLLEITVLYLLVYPQAPHIKPNGVY